VQQPAVTTAETYFTTSTGKMTDFFLLHLTRCSKLSSRFDVDVRPSWWTCPSVCLSARPNVYVCHEQTQQKPKLV